MKNLQEATERICELKGSQVALDVLVPAVVDALSASQGERVLVAFDAHAEAARTAMLHADISDLVLASFERDVARHRALIRGAGADQPGDESDDRARERPTTAADELLYSITRVATFSGADALTNASGFFFRHRGRLFVVSNRHVFADRESGHLPDRIELGVHVDAWDLTRHAVFSLPLYRDGMGLWREASDSGGAVDVAAMPIPDDVLPEGAVVRAFDETHLQARGEDIAIGDPLAIVGFPLGFHDTVHHLAVARRASIASAYGVRFQQEGCFLTDARTHRGSSGSPVVRRRTRDDNPRPAWQLLGVHSTRMDMHPRDQIEDESLGLNCAWYADVLATLVLDE